MLITKRLAQILAIASLASQAAAENLSPNLKFNGFATASAGVLNNDQGGEYLRSTNPVYQGISEDPNFTLESVLGLQFDYHINEKTNVVAQLVAQGKQYFDVNAEWAYIAYQFNDHVRLRAGHLGLPAFMYSDSIYVGQSYPWVRLPSEIYYATSTTSFTGADILYRQPLSTNWNLNAQLATGSSNTENFYTKNTGSATVSASNENLLLRASYTQSQFTSTDSSLQGSSLNVTDLKAQFSSAGMLYDDGRWFVAGEFGQTVTESWLPDWNAGYLSVGHYFDKWMPYILASTAHSFNEDDCRSIPGCVISIPGVGTPVDLVSSIYLDQSTYSLGAKYAVSSSFSIKTQIDKVIPKNGSNGFVGYTDDPSTSALPLPIGPGGSIVNIPQDESRQAHQPQGFYVFTLALTAAF